MHNPQLSAGCIVSTSVSAGRPSNHKLRNENFKPMPPYGFAIKQALEKNPDKLIVIRYGNDGWTHCAVENDDMFSEDPNPSGLVMPEGDHWTNYWWPLCDARVWVDWPFVTQSKTHAFVSYLLNVIKAREVSFYDQKAKDMIMVRRKGAVA